MYITGNLHSGATFAFWSCLLRRWLSLGQQNPKIDELPELGARQDHSSLTGNRLNCVGGLPPIEERKGIEETLRNVERIEIAVGLQRGTVWRSANNLITTDAQDLRNIAIN